MVACFTDFVFENVNCLQCKFQLYLTSVTYNRHPYLTIANCNWILVCERESSKQIAIHDSNSQMKVTTATCNCKLQLQTTIRWNDAQNILDKALRSYGMVPTRADRCCYVLYSLQSRKQAWEQWIQGAIAQQNGTKDAFTESRERSEMDAAFEKNVEPSARSPATSNPWQESSISLWMVFLEQVETKWNKVFWPDLENIFKLVQRIGMMQPLQDKVFVGHKIPKTGWNTKEDLHCTPSMSTMYRSLLGQKKLLQRRTQF